MDSIRQQKISSLLKKELAIIFQKESQTLFGGRFITVTQVRVTPDLGLAKTYLSIMASKDKEADLKMIREQDWKIRKILAGKVGKQLRKMPELAFYIDDSLDYYEEIDSLLKK
jgi:ribosome-binding factor A